MKVMLSQPMNGKSEVEIKAIREKAIKTLEGKGYEVINTYFDDEWISPQSMDKNGIIQVPVFFIAKSLEAMSKCHAVYFCKGWERARGCRVEHQIATTYGLQMIYEKEEE